MNYTEYKIDFKESGNADSAEIAMALLSDMGFDSFDDNSNELLCYIEQSQLELNSDEIAEYVSELQGAGASVTIKAIETVNWNKEWESNFQPIDIDNICRIRAPFHDSNPEAKHEIVIMPKMSFGTGHHATTYLMTKNIYSLDITGKKGLDMGSGTGVLAIAALQAGASQMDCIDIDDWAVENCKENLEANGCSSLSRAILGDASSIEGNHYDFILANINRNILLADMPRYDATLQSGGLLQMSGFLEIDLEDIEKKAESLGYKRVKYEVKDNWCCALFQK
ncbi:MAG: 50S ribosomal protein L11 methyltransferase [Rikenellaceae bacterium]